MKKTFVREIQERDWVDTPFLVRDKVTAMAKNGRPYLTIKLMDCTGEVEGRIWERVDEMSARFSKDDFVRVAGKASVYMGKMQLVLQELERLEESLVDLTDFLPVSDRPPAAMVAELTALVEGMTDPALKGLMQGLLADRDFMAGYTRAPAAKTMHPVCLGGLLEHSLAVAALAEDICRRYPDLNRDLLVTGALLHDIGKVAELRYLRSFEYTDAGKLLGHIVLGVEMVEEKLREVEDFPPELAIHLKHLLISHHGQYEFGSPKRPKTVEALILNFLDDLDSKINGVRTHIEREPDSDSAWTQYHRLYDRYFFKGAAMRDAAESPPAPAPPTKIGRAPEPSPSTRRPGSDRSGFSNTLADQLRAKNVNLSDAAEKDVNNE